MKLPIYSRLRCHFVPGPPQRRTSREESCCAHFRKTKTDSDLGPHFANFSCVTAHVDHSWTKQQLHSGLEGICSLQVLSYSTPTGAVSGPLMETKSYWKVPQASRRHKHTRSGIAVLPELLIEAKIAYAVRHVSNSVLNLWWEKKYINTYFFIWASYTLVSVYVIRQSVPAPSPGWILTYMYIYMQGLSNNFFFF